MFAEITLKFEGMRKAQSFSIVSGENILIQSDKSIAHINRETGEMKYNLKGCHFPHLNVGVKTGVMPPDILQQIKDAVTEFDRTYDKKYGGITIQNFNIPPDTK